jgi:hypothetical protein
MINWLDTNWWIMLNINNKQSANVFKKCMAMVLTRSDYELVRIGTGLGEVYNI